MVRDMGYSLQANRKTEEGKQHPDRDAQFQFIAKKVRSFQRRQQPAISIDAKKREIIGNFKNSGQDGVQGKSSKGAECMTSQKKSLELVSPTACTT